MLVIYVDREDLKEMKDHPELYTSQEHADIAAPAMEPFRSWYKRVGYKLNLED